MFRPHVALLFLCLLASPALASAEIDQHLETMAGATSEQAFFSAAQDLVELGPEILPDLTERLVSSEDENARIDLTFLIATIMGQAGLQQKTIEPPPGLAEEVASLLHQPADIALEANLANIAGLLEPQPRAITEGLLALLARSENEGLRATTSAVIAMHVEPSSLPLIHDALRESPSDIFSGDVAMILRGTALPDDIAEIFVTLLGSDNAEARQSASRLLDGAGIASPAQLDAALSDLAVAKTDMQLLTAAMAIGRHTDGSVRVADALERAMSIARRIEERVEIIRAFGASGATGHTRFAQIIRTTTDPDLVHHLMLGARSSPDLSANAVIAEAFIDLVVTAEDAKVAEEAAFALRPYRDVAGPAIEARLNGDDLSRQARDRLIAVLEP